MSSGLRARVAATFATGVTNPPAPRAKWLRRGRVDFVFVADVLTALICLAITDGALGTQNVRHGSHHSAAQLLLISCAVCAPLVIRTFLPLTAWVTSALAMAWASSAIPPNTLSTAPYIPAGVLVYGLCVYAVAIRCKTWVVATAGVVTMLGGLLVNRPTALGAVLVAAVPISAGIIVRSRRAARVQLQVQVRRYEGERALLEERQRIARELHDVVAHHMSVIAIQAEAAPYKTADPPSELVESFAEIRSSALSGLSELRRVLGVLRSDKPEIAPQPGLDDLASLLESARNGGVIVASSITGTPRPLADGLNLSAYRIVQEALSNAMRHAPGSSVQVNLYYGAAALVIEVRNDGCPAEALMTQGRREGHGPGDGGGHGIIGMQERAAMLGGHLQAGPTGNGEFLVTAAFPLGDGEPEDAP
jgi:signal transduction histidine kinase